jgi:hypothetical protein
MGRIKYFMEQDMFIDEGNYECTRNMSCFIYRGQAWRLDHNGRSSKGKRQNSKQMEYEHFRRVLVLIKRLVSHLR